MAARASTDHPKADSQSGSGLAERVRGLAQLPRELALARLGYGLKQPVFALPIYRYSLSGGTATALELSPSDPWSGNAAHGNAIVQGIFSFAGLRVAHPAPLWTPVGVGPEWLAELHGFSWLRDLRAAGGDAARRRARELVGAWLAHNGTWNPVAWAPLAAGRRLANWLACYEFFAASAEIEFRHRLFGAMARQARHLQRVLPAGLAGAELVAAVKGLIYAGVCLPGGAAWRERGLAILRRQLGRQILTDGGHAERNPSGHLAVLRDLIDLRATLHKGEVRAGTQEGGETHAGRAGVPSELQNAIEAMAPMLRTFQHGDGGLALFNGSDEDEGWRIDAVLQRAGGRRQGPPDAAPSGFQRLRAGRTVVLLDAGAPPPPGLDRHAHAGTLSLEVSVGRERLIVNCGALPGDPAWRWAERATAAHSTLVLNETNSSELLSGGLGRRAGILSCRRDEADGNLWLEASHDGYRRSFGVIHRRRLFLAAGGADLRGEDRLEPQATAQRAKPAGYGFVLRFHLHPDVQASLAHGGDAALLRLARGGGWRLRAAGAEANLEPSIYLGRRGEIRRTQQVVFSGTMPPAGTAVQWALKRIRRKGG